MKKLLIITIMFVLSLTIIGCDFLNQYTVAPVTTAASETTPTTTSSQSPTTTEVVTTITTTEEQVTTTQTTQVETTEITTEEQYSSIAEVVDGTTGDTYTVRATIWAISSKGVLLYDEEDYIYVFLGARTSLVVGDYVEAIGTTSEFGGKVQFASGTTLTKVDSGTFVPPTNAQVLSGETLGTFINDYEVGDYIELTGTVLISGSYVNFIINGSTVVGSFQFDSGDDVFSSMNGMEITIRGYALYVSGTTTKYFNILVNELNEDLSEFTTIADVKSGTIGDEYTTRGTVAAISSKGLLISDETDYIFVFLNMTPTVEEGDYVEVIGMTSEFGGQVQLGSVTSVSKLEERTYTLPTEGAVLTGADLSVFLSEYTVGQYIELSGTVLVSGSYVNFTIEGSSTLGSLQFDSNDFDFTAMNGMEVTIRGYALYVSGSTTQYFNILVKEVEEDTTEISSIADVTAGSIGVEYTTRGNVIGVSATGLLIEDDEDAIFIFLGSLSSLTLGDYVEVVGTTSEFGGKIQFTSDAVVTKIQTNTYSTPSGAEALYGSGVDTFISDFEVGEYVMISGMLTISGSYVNVSVTGTDVVISLSGTGIDYASFDGTEVSVYGYALYVSGSTTHYFNILANQIVGNTTIDYDSIATVKAGTLGETYTTRGTIIGLTTKGLLMYDNYDYIYVYLNAEPALSIGDYIEVTGTTSEFGGEAQFNSDSVVTKLSDGSYNDPEIAAELIGSGVDSYVSDLYVGDYIELEGTLVVNGSYINLYMNNTSIVGSLLAPSGFDFATYHNQEVTLRGYALYLSGSTTHYFNVLVKDVYVATTSSVFDLTILEVNDLHGYIEQDDDGTGGISNMAYLIDQIRADNPLDDVVLIANGDMFQGTAISNMTYGLAVIECMNMMDFDVMGIGNHEFDWTIENILAYFDGDESNGEADFPLLNANIYLLADDTLLTVIDGNMFTYTIIEREGIQIGVISYVGNIYYSISQVVVADYYFDLDIAGSVTTIANDLRDAGVDIVIVNIHDGDSSGVEYYSVNNQLAQLKATDGTYLVDAVINGHTHSYQSGSISRTNGVAMPVVQAGGKGNAFGEIVLTIDTDTMTVTASTVQLVYVDTAGTNHDTEIETYITHLKE